LSRTLSTAREFLFDATKHQNKLSKDEKVTDQNNRKPYQWNRTISSFQKRMEKYISETLKWLDENQHVSNAVQLFSQRINEAEEFFAPFYASLNGKTNLFSS
jgi:hypothetical protein